MYEDLKVREQRIGRSFKRLVEIVGVLRIECPWDREQNHQSLRACLIEEAYELADAIDREDLSNMKEELGDVLLQVVFHSLLALEEEAFSITDVINDECEKMIRRHPHVFSGEDCKSVDKVLEKWENIKVKENHEVSHTCILEQIPKALPALVRSYKVQEKASRIGFDWKDTLGPLQKLEEEVGELTDAYKNADEQQIAEELGDVLFSVVNLARFLGVEPEEALGKSTAKFIRRFAYVEEKCKKEGLLLEDMELPEIDIFWEEAKQKEVVR